jgi:hypothetical protein
MELMSVGRGKIWVHSEAKGNGVLSNEDLLKGIPGWESANASYLQHVRNAEIVTPETFAPLVIEALLPERRRFSAPVMCDKFLAANYQTAR